MQGSRGAQGNQGTQGRIGITGAQGVRGYQGLMGRQGFQGIRGFTGAGTQGTQGMQGTQASQGTTGEQGTQGTQGLTGQGLQGQAGSTQGAQGKQGSAGGGVPIGQEGEVLYNTQDNTSNAKFDDLVNIEPIIISSEAEAQSYFTVPGPPAPTTQAIFNNWYRFSHNLGNNYPANPLEVSNQQWSYDSVNDELVGFYNTGTAAGFVSDLSYAFYTHSATLSSSDQDNDTIGIVIAFTTEGTLGQPGYKEHTLTAFRTTGGTMNGRTWGVAYNIRDFSILSQYVIADGSSAVPATGIWPQLGSTSVSVDRRGNTIICKTSPFGSSELSEASTLTVDLTDNTFVDENNEPILERFRGGKPYGYMAFSQGRARFGDLVFSGVAVGENVVYDVVSGKVYGPSENLPYYQEIVGAATFNDIAEPGRFYNNPTSHFTTWRSSFDENNYIIGRVGSGSGDGLQGATGVTGAQGTTGEQGVQGGSAEPAGLECVDCDYDEPTDTNNSVAIHSKQSMYLFIDDNNDAGEDSNYFGFYNNLDPYSDTVNKDNTIFRIDEDGSVRTSNAIYATTDGIIFPTDAYGGSGDTASIYLAEATGGGGEATQLTLKVTNDSNDEIYMKVPDDDGVKINGYTVWHEGNHDCGNDAAANTGGEALASRDGIANITSTLSDGETENLDLDGYYGYAIYTIKTNRAAWVRLYINDASRTADASRNEFTDPDPDAGVILEVITAGEETVVIAPAVFGFNGEDPPTTTMPMAVTNRSGESGTVRVEVNAVKLEGGAGEPSIEEGGLGKRTDLVAQTATLSDGAIELIDLDGYKGYGVYAIKTNRAAWVTLYADGASRTADASRNEFTDPEPDAGVILEVITNTSETVVITPAVIGHNREDPPTTNIPMRVKNISGESGTVQVTITALQLEG